MKVEINKYYPINKGALKASFSVIIYPEGQKILQCQYMEKGDNKWFSFPQKEVKKEGEKSDYIPLISYVNKTYENELKAAILAALKEYDDKQKTQSKNPTNASNDVSGEAFPVW